MQVVLAPIAAAVADAERSIPAQCPPLFASGNSGDDPWIELAERVDRRSQHADLLPPQLVEEALFFLSSRVEEVYRLRLDCGALSDSSRAPLDTPDVPICVQRDALREARAAQALALLGYPEAAQAMNDAAARFQGVECPPVAAQGQEPIRCACGDQITRPNSIIYGVEGWPLGFDDEIFVLGTAGSYLDAPRWGCPTWCEDAAYAAINSRESRRLAPAIAVTYYDRGTLLSSAARPKFDINALFQEAASCGGGSAEWLGSWTAWNGARTADQCVANAANAVGFAPGGWSAVEVHP